MKNSFFFRSLDNMKEELEVGNEKKSVEEIFFPDVKERKKKTTVLN